MIEGLVVMAMSGRYRVEVRGQTILASPRGRIRKDGGGILTGDLVQMDETTIESVLPRKNALVRPPVANVDMALLVVTLKEPWIPLRDVDRRLAFIHLAGVRPVVALNKADLIPGEERDAFVALYRKAGYQTIALSAKKGEGLLELLPLLGQGITVFSGPSGAGKSTLLSRITGRELLTGTVSKTDRGKHTTKWVELLAVGDGYVCDTPGFSAMDVPTMDLVEVARLFPEIGALSDRCRFSDCLHRKEPDCAVHEAVEAGDVAPSRYGSYLAILEEVPRPW